jgi:hypothetical protein
MKYWHLMLWLWFANDFNIHLDTRAMCADVRMVQASNSGRISPHSFSVPSPCICLTPLCRAPSYTAMQSDHDILQNSNANKSASVAPFLAGGCIPCACSTLNSSPVRTDMFAVYSAPMTKYSWILWNHASSCRYLSVLHRTCARGGPRKELWYHDLCLYHMQAVVPTKGDPSCSIHLVSFKPYATLHSSATPFGGKIELMLRLADLPYRAHDGNFMDKNTCPKAKVDFPAYPRIFSPSILDN